MAVLTVAVILIALIALLNLAVTTALVRRMRELQPTATRPEDGLHRGEPVPEFTVERAGLPPLTREALRERPTLVAFFATTCPQCASHAAEFARRTAEPAFVGTRILPVLLDTGEDRRGLRALLSEAAEPVVDGTAAELSRLFRSRGTPAYFLIGTDGTVAAKGPNLASLSLPLPHPAG